MDLDCEDQGARLVRRCAICVETGPWVKSWCDRGWRPGRPFGTPRGKKMQTASCVESAETAAAANFSTIPRNATLAKTGNVRNKSSGSSGRTSASKTILSSCTCSSVREFFRGLLQCCRKLLGPFSQKSGFFSQNNRLPFRAWKPKADFLQRITLDVAGIFVNGL